MGQNITSVMKENDTRRNRILLEILQSEQAYVQSLKLLISNWEKPLRDASLDSDTQIISKEEIRSIFSNAEALLHFHEMILESLKPEDLKRIGLVFIKNAPGLKL